VMQSTRIDKNLFVSDMHRSEVHVRQVERNLGNVGLLQPPADSLNTFNNKTKHNSKKFVMIVMNSNPLNVISKKR